MKYLKLYERRDYHLQNYLDGYEKILVSDLNKIDVSYYKLTSLKGIENCIGLIHFFCRKCNLKNLNGIENCINLESIDCRENLLKNLDELNNLPKLKTVYCFENTLEYPLPEKLEKKCVDSYSLGDILHFKTYESQKKLLEEHPERINLLKELDVKIHEKIREEYPDIVEGNEFVFFGLR